MIEINREYNENGYLNGMTIKTEEGRRLEVLFWGRQRGYLNKMLLFGANGSCDYVWSGEYMRGRIADISDDPFGHDGVRVYVNKAQKVTKIEVGDRAVVKMDGVVIDEASIKRRKRMLNPYDKKLGPQRDLILQRLAIIAAVKKIDDIQKLAAIRARAEKVLKQQKKAQAR